MILNLFNNQINNLYNTLVIVSFTWIAVAIAISIDLYFGVKKAKKMGECTTSEGFRRTVTKAAYYYALMFFALIFDAFDVVTPYFLPKPLGDVPLFSLGVTLGLVLNEVKSVREKAEDKVRRRSDQTFKEMIKLIKERQDIIDKMLNHLKNEKNNGAKDN